MPYRILQGVHSGDTGQQVVILNTNSGLYYALDGVAKDIWVVILEGGSILEMAPRISRDYGITLEQATNDIEDFLVSLLSAKLVEETA